MDQSRAKYNPINDTVRCVSSVSTKLGHMDEDVRAFGIVIRPTLT